MYCRLKFEAGNIHFNDSFSGKSISRWIQDVLNGTNTPAELPSAAFNLSNCVVEGSLPSNITVTHDLYTSSSPDLQTTQNYLQFTKQHSQNSNFVKLFRIYQNQYWNYTRAGAPRMFSANATNGQPTAPGRYLQWYNETTGNSTSTGYTHLEHGLSEAEYQFFISSHWVIWSVISPGGSGGTAGLFDVESTGQDVWARTLNSLYSPQIFITSNGATWPTSDTPRVTEDSKGIRFGIYSNLMYNGDDGFVNRGTIFTPVGIHQIDVGDVTPVLYPDPGSSFYSTRDNIGDTQNFMMPVYMYSGFMQSTTTPPNRATLNGRIPFLWRTTDNAAQTGQKATVGGVEYRFVRMHPCSGIGTTSDINAATYMVPTTIGGV
mgnify:CR=1 FL=1